MFVNYSVILKGDPTGDINILDVKDDPNLKVFFLDCRTSQCSSYLGVS